MKKKILSLVAIGLLIQSAVVVAREMRAPLPFRNGFQRFEHYPYICENEEKCWDFDVWGGAWHRQAFDAFTQGTTKETLAGLYFGADRFSLRELFPAGTQVPPSFNFVVTPRFNYSENGAMFGFNINHRLDCGCWDVGMRTNIPFRAITVTLENCCDLIETMTNVVTCVFRGNNNPAPELVLDNDGTLRPVEESFAYRLDFLSSLYQVMNPTEEQIADGSMNLVKYRANVGGGFHVTINNKVVDEANNSPIHVVRAQECRTPELPFAKRLFVGDAPDDNPYVSPGTQDLGVQNLPILPFDGDDIALIPNGARARFDSSVNYADAPNALENNVPNQRTLWVVPTAVGDPFELTADADNIRNFVTPFLLNELAQVLQTGESPIDFLRQRGITFDTQNLTGVGDLDVDFYARRNWCSECYGDWYVEGITGIRFPTGKRLRDAGLLLAQPLGNNHHFEIKVGAQVGIQPCEWFAVKADAQFYHVFAHNEQVAASFTGSRIKNIGPRVNARVSWNYFLGNLDFTFVVPCAKYCSGFDLGYQPYAKSKDKVRFDRVAAEDFLGNVRTLDPNVIEANTKRVSHRLKAELFHKTCSWEMYGGWLHTFAGKNIGRESDWYLGFGMFF